MQLTHWKKKKFIFRYYAVLRSSALNPGYVNIQYSVKKSPENTDHLLQKATTNISKKEVFTTNIKITVLRQKNTGIKKFFEKKIITTYLK